MVKIPLSHPHNRFKVYLQHMISSEAEPFEIQSHDITTSEDLSEVVPEAMMLGEARLRGLESCFHCAVSHTKKWYDFGYKQEADAMPKILTRSLIASFKDSMPLLSSSDVVP